MDTSSNEVSKLEGNLNSRTTTKKSTHIYLSILVTDPGQLLHDDYSI